MKNKLLGTAVILLCVSVCFTQTAGTTTVTVKKMEPLEVSTRYVPTRAQTVWIHALEWCESRGKVTAINPKDNDNTPSYYSFQFKPSTFKGYALKYKLLKPEDLDTNEELMRHLPSYELQKSIVTEMLNDKTVKWQNQFPMCVTKKIGYPPRY